MSGSEITYQSAHGNVVRYQQDYIRVGSNHMTVSMTQVGDLIPPGVGISARASMQVSRACDKCVAWFSNTVSIRGALGP